MLKYYRVTWYGSVEFKLYDLELVKQYFRGALN